MRYWRAWWHMRRVPKLVSEAAWQLSWGRETIADLLMVEAMQHLQDARDALARQ